MATHIILATEDNPYVTGEIPNEPIVHTFYENAAGSSPRDLTGYTARFDWRLENEAPSAASTAVATITDAAGGVVTYVFSGSEFTSAGVYIGELWVTDGGTHRETSTRFLWNVILGVSDTPPA